MDSITDKEVKHRVNALDIAYRSGEKDQIISQNEGLLAEKERKLWQGRLQFWGAVSIAVILLLLLGMRYFYLRQKNKRLRSDRELERLKARIEGEEQERVRLAYELHDGINSQLAATHAYVEAVGKLYPQKEAKASLEHIRDMLSATSSELRTVAHNLSPDELLHEGIEHALITFCSNLFPDSGDVKAEVMFYGDTGQIPPDLTLLLYRTAQELLHNVRKHAQASTVILQLGVDAGVINLTIEDNGIGLQKIAAETAAKQGIGLRGIEERVHIRGGSLEVLSTEHTGTVISISFPVKVARV